MRFKAGQLYVWMSLAACALVLSACASVRTTAPALASARAETSDIGAVKRGDNLYDIVYMGKTADTTDYMRDMTLLQSARLCRSQGFSYFKASDTQTYTTHQAPAAPVRDKDSPQLTLQVSCLTAQADAPVSYVVETVIARVETSYKLK